MGEGPVSQFSAAVWAMMSSVTSLTKPRLHRSPTVWKARFGLLSNLGSIAGSVPYLERAQSTAHTSPSVEKKGDGLNICIGKSWKVSGNAARELFGEIMQTCRRSGLP
jgi:hypothetical protein